MANRLKAWHIYAAVALACAVLLAVAAFYFQGQLGLAPCPLCILQRYAFMLLGLTALVATLHRASGRVRHLYTGMMLAWAATGAAIAIWQISLSYRAASVSCKISAEERFVNGLPLAKGWPAMFEAYGDCVGDGYTLLGLSVPAHALIVFGLLAALVVWAARQRR